MLLSVDLRNDCSWFSHTSAQLSPCGLYFILFALSSFTSLQRLISCFICYGYQKVLGEFLYYAVALRRKLSFLLLFAYFCLQITNNFCASFLIVFVLLKEILPVGCSYCYKLELQQLKLQEVLHWHMCMFFSFGIGFLTSESCLRKKEIPCCILPFSLQVCCKIFCVAPDSPWLRKALEIQGAFLVTEESEVVGKVETESCQWVVVSAGC